MFLNILDDERSYIDILCTKVVDINQRGSKKDFFDFYHIVNKYNIKPEKLIYLLEEKFAEPILYKNFVYSLIYFEDADSENLPICFVDYNWDNIKSFCINYSKELIRALNQKF